MIEGCVGLTKLLIDLTQAAAKLGLRYDWVRPVVAIRSIQIEAKHRKLIGGAGESHKQEKTG